MKKPKKESFTEKYGLNPSSDDYLKGPFVKVIAFIVLTIIVIYSVSNSDYRFFLTYIYLLAPFALFLIPLFLWVQFKDWKYKNNIREKKMKEMKIAKSFFDSGIIAMQNKNYKLAYLHFSSAMHHNYKKEESQLNYNLAKKMYEKENE